MLAWPMSSPKMTRMLGFLSAASARTVGIIATRARIVICTRRKARIRLWSRSRARLAGTLISLVFAIEFTVSFFCGESGGLLRADRLNVHADARQLFVFTLSSHSTLQLQTTLCF